MFSAIFFSCYVIPLSRLLLLLFLSWFGLSSLLLSSTFVGHLLPLDHPRCLFFLYLVPLHLSEADQTLFPSDRSHLQPVISVLSTFFRDRPVLEREHLNQILMVFFNPFPYLTVNLSQSGPCLWSYSTNHLFRRVSPRVLISQRVLTPNK